eukprot:gene349-442_t
MDKMYPLQSLRLPAVRPVDVVDILLVILLAYQLYRLVRESVAVKTILGFFSMCLLGWIADKAGMQLLGSLVRNLTGFGLMATIVIFQNEIRKFLSVLGGGFFLGGKQLLVRVPGWRKRADVILNITSIVEASKILGGTNTGALVVISNTEDLKFYIESGDRLDALFSKRLLLAIFHEESPLHDGAAIIYQDKIVAARCILPVTERPNLPAHLGLRHRAAIGMSEATDTLVIVISEETGQISIANKGKLSYNLSAQELRIAEKSMGCMRCALCLVGGGCLFCIKCLRLRPIRWLSLYCYSSNQIFAKSVDHYQQQSHGFQWKNMQLRMAYGVRIMPYGFFWGKEFWPQGKPPKIFGVTTSMKTVFPHHFTLSVGYSWDLVGERKINLDLGLGYDFNRTVRMKEINSYLLENYLKLPFLLAYTQVYHTRAFDMSIGVLLGYEVHYIVKSETPSVFDTDKMISMRECFRNADVPFPNWSGNLFYGARFEFPKGFYVDCRAIIPIEILKIVLYQQEYTGLYFSDKTMLTRSMDYVRSFRNDFFQLILGIDLMQWLFPERAEVGFYSNSSSLACREGIKSHAGCAKLT